MNILITSKDDQPQFIGGDKRVGIILAHEWQRMGHGVCFVCHSTSPQCPEEVDGIRQYIMPDTSDIDTPTNREFLRSIIGREHIDIVLQQHLREPGLISLCARVRDVAKVVSVLHFDVGFDDKILAEHFFCRWRLGHSPGMWLRDALFYARYLLVTRRRTWNYWSSIYRDSAAGSDRVVLLSPNMTDSFCRRAGCPREMVSAIPNPASLQVNAEACAHKEKTVVWAGRLQFSQKRTDRMLRVWKKVSADRPEWRLKILGSGDLDYWRGQIERHQVPRAEVVGFCDPMPYYERASIVCMTSTSEGWGMTLIEGQAHGCAVMAYDSYGTASEIIRDGETGLLVEPFSIDGYARKLAWLMDHDEERAHIAARGAESVRCFDSCEVAQRWVQLFNSLK